MRTVKISRRAFLTGLGLASTAALLSACNTVPASSDSGRHRLSRILRPLPLLPPVKCPHSPS